MQPVKSVNSTLINDAERQELLGIPTDEVSLTRHYTIPPDEETFLRRRNERHNVLAMAIHVAYLKFPGRLWQYGEAVPAPLVENLAAQLRIPARTLSQYQVGKSAHSRFAGYAMEFTGLRPVTSEDQLLLVKLAKDSAQNTNKGRLIVADVLQGLRQNRMALPAIDTIERAAATGRAAAETEAVDAILTGLEPEQEERLLQLVVNNKVLEYTPLAWLRDVAEAPTPDNFHAIRERLEFVRAFGFDAEQLKSISPWRFRQLAKDGAKVTSSDLARYGRRKLLAVLIAQIVSLRTTLTDAGVEMFCKLIGDRFARAVSRQKRHFQNRRKDTTLIVRSFTDLVTTIDEARKANIDIGAAILDSHDVDGLCSLRPVAEEIANLSEQDTLITAARSYNHLRTYSPAFLDLFEFQASNPSNPVLRAIKLMRELNHESRRHVPESAPIGFLSQNWRDLVTETGGIDRHLYETALMATIRDRLRSGDLSVVGSSTYQPFDSLMVTAKVTNELAPTLPFDTNAETYLAERATYLDARMQDVFRHLKRGELQGVSLRDGQLSIPPLDGMTTKEVEDVAAMLSDAMPTYRITELFQRIDAETKVFDLLTDVNGRQHHDRHILMAAVWATASNIPLEKMAASSPGMTHRQLGWAQEHFISEENLQAATALLVDCQRQLPLAQFWGDGSVSSSDGQFVPTGRKQQGISSFNAKYGREPGVKLYSHVSDQYAPFYTRVIAASMSEIPHVLDGLVLHGSGLVIGEHHTDTGGASDLVFALGRLMGVRIQPRYRDFPTLRFGIMRPARTYKGMEDLLGPAIRTDIIHDHWPDILRLGVSLRQKALLPSHILRQVSGRHQQNQFAKALQELGRIDRTDHMLSWISDPSIRRTSQVMLNKGEMSHVLSDAIRIHKQGRIMDRTQEQQSLRGKAGQFVKMMVILSNTLDAGNAVEQLRSEAKHVPDEALAHISPLGTKHLIFNGDYLWDKAWKKVFGSKEKKIA